MAEKEFNWVRPKTVTYKILLGEDNYYTAFAIDGKQEVAFTKEKTIDALALKLFTPGVFVDVISGEKRGFRRVDNETLVQLKIKIRDKLIRT